MKYLKKKRQLEKGPAATVAEKEILMAIVSTRKKEMQEYQLRIRADMDVYVSPNSIHTLCARLMKKGMIRAVRKESGGGISGAPRNVFSVTTTGLEALK